MCTFPNLDPAQKVSRPEAKAHGCHRWPDDSGMGQVEAVQVLGQDFHLVEKRPETDRLLSDSPISSLLLAIPQEGSKVAGAAVVCQDN